MLLTMPESLDPQRRGYHAVYRDGEQNTCPGCGRSQWTIGRQIAECGFCQTALPLADGMNTKTERPAIWERGRGGGRVR